MAMAKIGFVVDESNNGTQRIVEYVTKGQKSYTLHEYKGTDALGRPCWMTVPGCCDDAHRIAEGAN